MTDFTISGSTGISRIMVGHSLYNFREYLSGRQAIIITDENVLSLYGHSFKEFPVIVIKSGEKNKTLQTVNNIYSQLLHFKADRSTFIVGIGGGIVCDIAGFAASTFMRGLRFGFVSTTLLSQVDASVGGKNGVNFRGFKNIVGTFNQPEFVICDPSVLETLPLRERSNGFAEIVKHALIADAGMFYFLEENYQQALHLDQEVISKLVKDSIRIKSEIVNRDEKESGERRLLNFGHTFGHAIEKIARLDHGQAVSLGMVIAARFSEQSAYAGFESLDRVKNLLHNLGLPVSGNFDTKKLLKAILKDKKRTADRIALILIKKIGQAFVKEIPVADLSSMTSKLIN